MQGQSSVGQFGRSWSLLPESRRLCRGKIAGKEEDRRQQCQILTDKLEGLCTIHFERANRLVKYWGQRLLPADDEPGCFGWGVRVCTVRAMQECGAGAAKVEPSLADVFSLARGCTARASAAGWALLGRRLELLQRFVLVIVHEGKSRVHTEGNIGITFAIFITRPVGGRGSADNRGEKRGR
jgi:hypothetical protein